MIFGYIVPHSFILYLAEKNSVHPVFLHFLLELPEPSSKIFRDVLAEQRDDVFGRLLEICDSRLHRFVGARSDGALCAKKERRDTRESGFESREKIVVTHLIRACTRRSSCERRSLSRTHVPQKLRRAAVRRQAWRA